MSSLNIGSPQQQADAFPNSPWTTAATAAEPLESLLQAAYSPKTTGLSGLLSSELGGQAQNGGHNASQLSSLYDDLQDSLFGNGSAPHTPRGSMSAQLFDATVGSPQRSSSITGSPLTLVKVCLLSFVACTC